MQSPENNTTPAAPNNDMGELRSHLFDTLRALKAKTIDAEQARAVNDTAQTIINSAKVEVDYLKATGQTDGSELFTPKAKPAALPPGINGKTVHRLK